MTYLLSHGTSGVAHQIHDRPPAFSNLMASQKTRADAQTGRSTPPFHSVLRGRYSKHDNSTTRNHRAGGLGRRPQTPTGARNAFGWAGFRTFAAAFLALVPGLLAAGMDGARTSPSRA